MASGTLKAIETRYKGYRFRSRLEARWAVYLDTVGLNYEYEPEGFTLENGEQYLPDFWLPDVQSWAEVKAVALRPEELLRCAYLVRGTGYQCVLLVGTPEAKAYERLMVGEEEWNHRPFEDLISGVVACDAFIDASYVSERRFYVCTGDGETFDPSIKRGIQAARSARFEFGESGPRR
jgi:hypothetical protein